MKRVIKGICIFTCMALILSALSLSFSAEESTLDTASVSVKDEKVYANATIEQNFVDNHVLVVMDRSVSAINKTHDFSSLKSVGISNVKDLTRVNPFQRQSETSLSSIGKEQLVAEENMSLINMESFRQILLFELPTHSKANVLEVIKKLESVEGIMYAGPDYITTSASIVPNDNYRVNQWAIEKIQLNEAWDITTGLSTIYVGVIDSGISSHIDLNANLVEGWDFYHENATAWDDTNGHGTHVAGIIGALGNNQEGIAGVSWNVKLVPLQVTYDDEGRGLLSDEIEAITYAMDHNIPVINYSRGIDLDNQEETFTGSPAFKQAVANYQGLFVCAAGNDQTNIDPLFCHAASYNLENMISVANTTSEDILYEYVNPDYGPQGSNYGATTVHLAAPGTAIVSTYPNNEYVLMSGTSMAAPYVTGVAALIKSIRPDLTAQEIKALILDNVDPLDSLTGKCVTGGRLNAYKAVRAATESKTFTGDVNGDGMADMILSRPYNKQWRQFIVCPGQSGGTFGAPINTTSARSFSSRELVCTGDFNGDGRTDVLLVSSLNQYYQLFVYLGKTDGKFNEAVCLTSSRESYTLENPAHYFVSDVNGDGKDDFVIEYLTPSTSSAEGYQRNILAYQGKAQSPYLTDAASDALAVKDSVGLRHPAYMGDFNGDGYADMAVSYVSSTNKQQFWVYAGNAGGTFAAGVNITTSVVNNYSINYSQMVVADTNNNGTDDIVMLLENQSGTKRLIVFQGSATGSFFQTSSNIVLSDTYGFDHTDPIFAGDVNGDGRSDVTVHWVNNGKRQLLVYAANANGAYSATGVNYASTNSHDPAVYAGSFFVGDVNGDGRDDFIVKWKSSNNVRFLTYCGTASGSFAAAVRTTPSPEIPYYDAA